MKMSKKPTIEQATESSDAEGGWPALFTAGLSVALILIDGFIVSIAAPDIMRSFSVGADKIGWLIGAYTLPLAVAPIVFGLAGDRFGVKRLFSIGVGLLMVASFLCAMSGTLLELVACRFLQGLGASILSPQTLAVAARSLGAARRGFAIGVWGAISSLALLLGPLMGAAILVWLPWHWIFLINLPLGLMVLLAFAATVPDRGKVSPAFSQRFPMISIGLLIPGTALFVLSLGTLLRGEITGAVGAIAGLAMIHLWLRRERRQSEISSLVGKTLLGAPAFTRAAMAAFAINASTAGTVAVVSLALVQAELGIAPAIATGILFAPAMLLVACFMPLAGKLAQGRSAGARYLLGMSALVSFASPLMIGWSISDVNVFRLAFCALAIAGQGIAAAVLVSYATYSAMAAAGPLRAGLASGAVSMARNLGTAVGAASLTGVAAAFDASGLAFWASAVLATISLPFCLFHLRPSSANLTASGASAAGL